MTDYEMGEAHRRTSPPELAFKLYGNYGQSDPSQSPNLR
jgi:hypothetical protein